MPLRNLSTCAICGHQQETCSLLSSNTNGHYDLDLRPPEMLRSSMHYWVQECEKCGYCATDIAEEIPNEVRSLIEPVIDLIRRNRTQNDKNLSELASRFCRQAAILTMLGEHDQAGWALMHAAWACDDDCPDKIGANECRMSAFDSFAKCKINGIQYATPNGYEEEIMVDILRRTGAFERANSHCFEVFSHVSIIDNPQLIDVLKFQRDLIWMGDDGCYNFGHIMEKMSSNAQDQTRKDDADVSSS